MQNETNILDYETCQSIGYDAEELIFTKTKERLNSLHPAKDGMPYFDSVALDEHQSEGLISNCNTPARKEIMEIIREEYRNLDELNRHCLFIYFGGGDIDENEIITDLAWHFEEVLSDRVDEILALNKSQNILNN